jgi:hypothetical protein
MTLVSRINIFLVERFTMGVTIAFIEAMSWYGVAALSEWCYLSMIHS